MLIATCSLLPNKLVGATSACFGFQQPLQLKYSKTAQGVTVFHLLCPGFCPVCTHRAQFVFRTCLEGSTALLFSALLSILCSGSCPWLYSGSLPSSPTSGVWLQAQLITWQWFYKISHELHAPSLGILLFFSLPSLLNITIVVYV